MVYKRLMASAVALGLLSGASGLLSGCASGSPDRASYCSGMGPEETQRCLRDWAEIDQRNRQFTSQQLYGAGMMMLMQPSQQNSVNCYYMGGGVTHCQ